MAKQTKLYLKCTDCESTNFEASYAFIGGGVNEIRLTCKECGIINPIGEVEEEKDPYFCRVHTFIY